MTDEQFNRQQWDRFNARIQEYIRASKLNQEDIVQKKGNDLRIQLFKGYKSRRWGGKRIKGIAMREFRARGGRIKLREGLQIKDAPTHGKNKKPLTDHQRLVWEELRLRQKGIGVLGASFLIKRWSKKKDKLIRNRTGAGGRKLADFIFNSSPISNECQFTIMGYTPALKKISDRYRIVSGALSVVSADMEKYLKRKEEETMHKVFH